MLLNQLVSKTQVDQNKVHNLLVGVVLFEALLDILQVCHIADFRCQWFKFFGSFEFFADHKLVGVFLKHIKLITSFRNLHKLLRLRHQNFPLLIRRWKYTLRSNSLIIASIVEVFEVTLLSRNYQQIEAIKHISQLLLPVFVMEVVVDPHKLLIDYLWHNIFLDLMCLLG